MNLPLTEQETAAVDFAEEGNTVTMSRERREAARQAAHEIEMLAITLRNIDTGDGFDLVVRGVSKRVEAMAQVVMSAICSKDVEISSLNDEIGLQ